jgi:outer membrane protein
LQEHLSCAALGGVRSRKAHRAGRRDGSNHHQNDDTTLGRKINMQTKQLASVLAATLLCCGAAQAADEGPWLVRGRAVSISFANGQADNLQATAKVEADNRWIPEVDISYFFSKNLAAELILTYPQTVDIKLNGAKQGTIKALPPTLLVQYHFTDLGAFKPYVGAGLNYTLFFDRDNILNGAASVERSSVGPAAQIGFDYALSKNLYLNVDVKYVRMNTDVMVSGAKVGKLNLNPTLVGIGIGYRF